MDIMVVGAVIVDDLNLPTRILAARRTRPAALAGRWELPGGKVELDEVPVRALHREIAEELGVDLVVGAELLAPDGDPWPLSPGLVMRTWWCRTDGLPAIATDGHDQLRWLGVGELDSVPWLDPDRPIVDAIRSRLVSPGPPPNGTRTPPGVSGLV